MYFLVINVFSGYQCIFLLSMYFLVINVFSGYQCIFLLSMYFLEKSIPVSKIKEFLIRHFFSEFGKINYFMEK